MIVGSLRTGEWSFHVGGLNGKGYRGRSWELIMLFLNKVIRGMKRNDIRCNRKVERIRRMLVWGGQQICSKTVRSFNMNVIRKRSGGS